MKILNGLFDAYYRGINYSGFDHNFTVYFTLWRPKWVKSLNCPAISITHDIEGDKKLGIMLGNEYYDFEFKLEYYFGSFYLIIVLDGMPWKKKPVVRYEP